MRNSISILILLSAFLVCLSSKAKEWTEITKGQNGHIFFVNMENLNESKGYIYFWQLINYNAQDEYGDMSAKIYVKAECEVFKFKWLKVSYHKMLMGKDYVKPDNPSKLVSGWQFPSIGSTSYAVLDHVCKNKGLLL
tara:strand:+ start:622 stop:1032 length:411 start_codon:yes stop_codon:yes gene_type:complete